MSDNELDYLYAWQIANCAKIVAIAKEWGECLQWILVYEQQKSDGNVIMKVSDLPESKLSKKSNNKQLGIAHKTSELYNLTTSTNKIENIGKLPELLDFCMNNKTDKNVSLTAIIRYNTNIQLFNQFSKMIDGLLKDYCKTEKQINKLEITKPIFTLEIKEQCENSKKELIKCIKKINVNANIIKNNIFLLNKKEINSFNNILKSFGLDEKDYGR